MTQTPTPEPEFGTSGLRGPADALTDDLVGRYTRAFVESFSGDGTIWIGRDLRNSSPRISNAVKGAAASGGLIVIDAGVLPTPALALSAMGRGTISIMVTGSHIPADRNGLKFYRADGEIDKADEARLIAAAAAAEAPVLAAQPAAVGDGVQTYIARYVDFFGKRSLRGERIGVWQHSSAAADVLPALIDALGGEAVPLGRSDVFVPIDTEAVDPEIQKTFAEWIKAHMLDAVVSADADADRPLLTDENGRIVPGDVLGPIAAHSLGATHVVTTVSANTVVDLMGVFSEVHRTRIGSPYVIEAMNDLSGEKVIGYEPNGGMLLGYEPTNGTRSLQPLMTRDCALPLLLTLLAGKQNGGISKVVSALPRRRTATGRLTNVPTNVAWEILTEVAAGDYSVLPKGIGEPLKIDTTDGIRLTFGGDIILMIRPSKNAPELRAYVEVANAAAAAGFLDVLLGQLKRRVAELASPSA